jgi:hypothetical protein
MSSNTSGRGKRVQFFADATVLLNNCHAKESTGSKANSLPPGVYGFVKMKSMCGATSAALSPTGRNTPGYHVLPISVGGSPRERLRVVRMTKPLRGHAPPTREETDKYLQAERDSWGDNRCVITSDTAAVFAKDDVFLTNDYRLSRFTGTAIETLL